MRRVLAELTVPPEASLREALAAIDRGAIEVVFVRAPDGRIVGTLTDGDVRRAILRGVPLDVPAVEGAMRRSFTSVAPAVSRAEVLDLMRARSISQVPVLDERGALVGLHLLTELIGAAVKPNWALIMAGGRGTRLYPLTETIPKPMLTVAGRPILERLVMHLVGYGIREVFLSVHYLSEIVERHFGDGSAFGCRIRYLREEQPLGTGGALSMLPEAPRHPLLVMNGDLVTQVNVDRLLEEHRIAGRAMTVAARPYQVEIPFGVLDVDETRVVGLREKPSQQMLVNAGIYVISPEVVARVPPATALPMTTLVEQCLEGGLPVGAHLVADEWIDVGRHDELKKARSGA
jgi:dTDP-glucose pyrophosphorylase/predicted transcriptional regulator